MPGSASCQDDDLGRDYITGLKAGHGDKGTTMIVGEACCGFGSKRSIRK